MSGEEIEPEGTTPGWLKSVATRAIAGAQTVLGARRFGPLIAELFPDASGHELLVANEHAAVLRLDHGEHEPATILKIANSELASHLVHTEAAALEELQERDALGEWRSLVPSIRNHGVHEGAAWFTQSVLDGLPTTAMSLQPDEIVTRAAAALQPLHLATEIVVMADDAVLNDVVTEPLNCITSLIPALTDELTALNGECRQRLASLELRLARQHGDFGPATVLWDEASQTVSGIADWQLAMKLLPPEVDYVHFSLRLIAQRGETAFGGAVTAVLVDALEPEIGAPVRTALDAGPNDLDLRTAVAITWLHYVAYGLTNNEALRTNDEWLAANVHDVVMALDRT